VTTDEAALLEAVIDRGIASVLESYPSGDPRQLGGVEGFEACRGKTPEQMLELMRGMWDRDRRALDPGRPPEREARLRERYAQLQVEWCLNALAALDWLRGQRTFEWLPHHPTLRAATLVLQILGVAVPA
jgi:hypothetical protein